MKQFYAHESAGGDPAQVNETNPVDEPVAPPDTRQFISTAPPPARYQSFEPQNIAPQPAPAEPAATVPVGTVPLAASPQPIEQLPPPVTSPGYQVPAPAPAPQPAVPQEPVTQYWPTHNGIHPLVAMLVGGALACLLIVFGMMLQAHRAGTTVVDPLTYTGTNSHLSSPESGNAIVQAVQAVGPAVMNVDTTFGKVDNPDFLPIPGAGGDRPLEGKGTGVVIDSARGLMLTNAHVVAGAQNIQVTNRDGEKYTGKILGSDRLSDIAVVQLNVKGLPAAKLARMQNAHDLAIGSWAIAIGNPYAQANSVTVGVVSAVGRSIDVPGGRNGQASFRLTDMVQTDAAINPGNSGGPLCNIHGEVIGINTAIIPFATGLGFTIPINKAMSVAKQLIENGRVQHPYIGINMQIVTESKQKELGLPDTAGALIVSTESNSPAAKAGIQVGDVIRALDGHEMKTRDDVQHYITDKKVGDKITVDVLRNNTVKKTFTIVIGDRPNAE